MDNSLPTPNINLDNQPDSITVVFSKKKLFISLIVFSLFSAIFGVLAYQAGIYSQNKSFITPTIPISNYTPTTSIPISSYPTTFKPTCRADIDCPKVDCVRWPCPSYQCINQQCVFVTPVPTQKIGQGLCVSDKDCKVEILCENPSGFCCSRGQCINGACIDHQSSPGKCD